MNKKSKRLLLVLISVVVIGTIVGITNSDGFKIRKGNIIFGEESCKCRRYDPNDPFSSLPIGGTAMTDWKCKICGHKDTNGTTNVPKLCYKCSETTKRCSECGKLEKWFEDDD